MFEDVIKKITARSADIASFTGYQKSCINQFAELYAHVEKRGLCHKIFKTIENA